MTSRTIVIIDEATRQRAIEAVAGILPSAKSPLEVVIQAHKAKKSLDQLAMYFWLCDQAGRHTGHTKDEMDDVFVEMFVPQVAIALPDGREVLVRKRPSKWNRAEASYVIERVLAWIGQEGIRLPPRPNR